MTKYNQAALKITIKNIMTGLMLAGALAACTSEPNTANPSKPLMQIDDAVTGDIHLMPAVNEVNGKLAALYQSKDGRVTYKYDQQSIKLDEQTPIKGGKWFQLNHNGQAIYASWWSPQNQKSLYLSASKNQGQTFTPATVVNQDQNMLPPYALMADSQGAVSMTYMDERNPKYNVYANHSSDFGATWAKPDQRLDAPAQPNASTMAMYPQALKAEDAWVIAWTDTVESMGHPVYRMLARRSIDQGKTWGEAEVLLTESAFISALTSDQQGKNFVLMFDAEGKGVQALSSNDAGKTWLHATEISGTQKLTNNFIRTAVSENKAYAVWIEESPSNKPRIMRGILDMASGTWVGVASRMDIKPFDNTKSSINDIITTQSGDIIVGWMDFRDIRPNIYLSASFDKGASWTTPQSLAQPGMSSLGYFEFIPWKNGAAINYQSFPADDVNNGSIIIQELSINAPKGFVLPDFTANQPDSQKREALLKQRVNAFWKHRIDKQYAESYAFFDPAYRKSFTQEIFTNTQGMLTYHAAKLVDYSIKGNEATVNLKITYEAKEAMFSGKPVSIPSSEADVTNTWVWIGDNWYMVFKPTIGDPMLVY